MSRDQHKWIKGGIFVPRWVVVFLVAVGLLFVGVKIMVPPKWELQRIDSPNGEISARLMRNRYVKDHFSILVKQNHLWNMLYYSGAITNDHRTDPEERLLWSRDSEKLYFRLNKKIIWGYDFTTEERIHPSRLPTLPKTRSRF